MHVARVRSIHGGREYESVLLRQTYREGGKVRHRTLASLTSLPAAVIDVIERTLRGERLVPAEGGGMRILRSLPHGILHLSYQCCFFQHTRVSGAAAPPWVANPPKIRGTLQGFHKAQPRMYNPFTVDR